MTRHINDHMPVGASVTMSEGQIARIEAVIGEALEPVRHLVTAFVEKESAGAAPAALSSEQFSELKALLQPGFELSSLMLEDYKAQRAAPLHAPAKAPEPAPDADVADSSQD